MNNTDKRRFKRTRYLISKKFQLRYVGIIVGLMFLSAVICSYLVYYTIMILMGAKLASVYPQGRLVAIINNVNLRMLFTMIAITPIVAVIGIYLSHKIAGPIYRIERFLTDMAGGNFSSKITLRKGDELISIANKLNELIDSLKLTIGNQKISMEKIIAEIGDLKKIVDSKPSDMSDVDKKMDNLAEEIKVLEKQLEYYKI